MKKDTQDRESGVVNRRLQFDKKIYAEAERVLAEENAREGRVKRNEKKYLDAFLPELVADGLEFKKLKERGLEIVPRDSKDQEQHTNSQDVLPLETYDLEHDVSEIARFNKWKSLTKADVKEIKASIIQGVENGDISACEVLTALASFKKVFLEDSKKDYKTGNITELGLRDSIMDYAIKEVEQMGKLGMYIGNFELTVKEAGARYDFSADDKWINLEARLQVANEAKKARENYLKSVPQPDPLKGIEPITEFDEETGELKEVRPPVKSSTTIVQVSLKK